MVLRLFKRLFGALRIGDYGSARNESVSQDDVKTVNDLPNNCLRGLRKANWVDARFLIATEAFIPDSRTAAGRQDGGKETSVNWEDDSQVENFTLADKSNAQYGAGCATYLLVALANPPLELPRTLPTDR